jgi:PTH1 family peptidyl-tRNA hydrolase
VKDPREKLKEARNPDLFKLVTDPAMLTWQDFFYHFYTMKYLVAGLGNIGPEYELTRHNIGFLVLDQLAERFDASFSPERYADKSEISYKGRKIHLIKPSTYMNLSGKAVHYWLQQLKIPKENLLVIVDDIALPFGKLRMRAKGSAAGHNGLKNIEDLTGGQNYPRLKFGIGSDFPKGRQVDYVLSNFTPHEFKSLDEPITKACDMALGFCTIGIQRTMSQYND